MRSRRGSLRAGEWARPSKQAGGRIERRARRASAATRRAAPGGRGQGAAARALRLRPARDLQGRAGAGGGAARLLRGHRARAHQRGGGARRLHRRPRRAGGRLRARAGPAGRSEAGRQPQVEFGFLLHDVGKVAIPDGILHKAEPPGRGGAGAHAPPPGDRLRDRARHRVRSRRPRRSCATTTSAGTASGYPDGLAGEEIPLAARIFSVVDTLDAMTTDRPYRPGVSLAQARAEIRGMAGTQFDPAVVDALDADSRRDARAHPDEMPRAGASAIASAERADRRRRPLHPQAHRHDPRGRGGVRAGRGSRRPRGGGGGGARAAPSWSSSTSTCPSSTVSRPAAGCAAAPETADATIVMLTAAAGDAAERDAEDGGGRPLPTKPFSPLELLHLVRRARGRRRRSALTCGPTWASARTSGDRLAACCAPRATRSPVTGLTSAPPRRCTRPRPRARCSISRTS